MCTVFIASLLTSGCNEKGKEHIIIDEFAFFEILGSAPFVTVPKEDLPEWLQQRIERWESGENYIARIFRGKWNGRVVYFIRTPFQSCPFCDISYENGERLVWEERDEILKFTSTSKDWVKIYQIGPDVAFGVVPKNALSDIARLSVEDKFEFPDISHLNDWNSVDIMPQRFKALQLPDGGFETNFFARAHLIAKISPKSFEKIPMGYENHVFQLNLCAPNSKQTMDVINELSYKIIK